MGPCSIVRIGSGSKLFHPLWKSRKITWFGRALIHSSRNLNENFPNINLTGSYLRTHGDNNPTLSHRIIRCPYPDISFPDQPLHEFVWSGLSQWSDKKALTCAVTGRTYTYAQARDVARRFGAALVRRGLQPGEVIAICLPNAPEYPLVFLGALEAGLTITALGTNSDEEDMRRQLYDSKPVAAVGAGLLLHSMIRAGEVAGLDWKVVIELPDDLPGAGDLDDTAENLLPLESLLFEEIIEEEKELSSLTVPYFPDVSGDDVAVIPFTSGTTGPPKGVLLSHANTVASICQIFHEAFAQSREASEGYQEELVCSVPFYHLYGMVVVMIGRLRLGGHLITMGGHEVTPEYYLQCLEKCQSTALVLTPSLLLWLAAAPSLPARHLERVHTVMCGGSPLAPGNAARLISRLKPSVSYQQGYGTTETTTAITQTSRWERSLGTAGHLVPNTRAKVVEPEGGVALGSGHTGEIVVKGPQVMVGYLNDEAAMEKAFDSEGWFRTGDLGFYDDEHRFHVVDRLQEVIRVSGTHTLAVAPAELEQLLRAHPGVRDAAVVALPDPDQGEVPRAFVVRAATASGERLTERELSDLIAQKTPPYKHLAGGIVFVDELPTSPIGNVKRYLLKEQ